jgi:glutathione synthase/RimK-type ligase-like ATP-grasp enzyme
MRAKATRPKILIVAAPDDLHARVIGHFLKTNFEAAVLNIDLTGISPNGIFTYSIRDGTCCLQMSVGSQVIDLDDLTSIWWRRPGRLTPGEAVTDPAVRTFCQREYQSLIWGVLEGASSRVINRPSAEGLAAKKPHQLRLAQRVGLKVPRTLMTNDPQQVKAFYEEVGGACVYKTFTAPWWKMVETRLFTKDDFLNLPKLRHAPAIFQEYVVAARHIRVSIFGDEIFAASVNVEDDNGLVDHRLRPNLRMEPWAISNDLASKLNNLRVQLGLDYGCVDLIESRDGVCWFLEFNPSGQFLYVEIETGMPLAMAMARLLIGHEVSGTPASTSSRFAGTGHHLGEP